MLFCTPTVGSFDRLRRVATPTLQPWTPILPPLPADSTTGSQLTRQAKVITEPVAPSKEPDKLTGLEQKLEALSKNLTITTGDPEIKVVFGGAIIADFLFNSRRPVAPGTPFFLTAGPLPGFHQQTFDASARQTTLTALVSGP